MMAKRAAYVVVIVLALHCAAEASKRVYEQGKLIDLSPIYLDTLLSGGTFLWSPRLLLGYELQIQVGENTYFVNVATCCPSGRQQKFEWGVGNPIQFRTEKHKMFVRRPNGRELKARLVKVVAGITSPSLSRPFIASGPAFPLPLDKPSHHKRLPLSMDFLRAEDMCLFLSGDVGAGDFFDRIRVRKAANGVQFRRGTQIVETFPESVVVSVIAVLGQCTATERSAQWEDVSQKDGRFDEKFMESVTFDGSWKEGFVERPAEFGPLAEGRIPNPIPQMNDQNDWWEYRFEVKSKDIRLANALVIVIHSPDGKMLARLSARVSSKR